MSKFEFVIAFVSIVIAFAVSEILSGVGRIIRERSRVTISWVHLSWMVLAVVVMTLHWWSIWSYEGDSFNNYFKFLALLLPSLTFVVLAFLLAPTLGSDDELDLREYYLRHRIWLAGLGAIIPIEFALLRTGLASEPLLHQNNVFRLAATAVFVFLAFNQDIRTHGIALAVMYTLLLGFIAVAGFA